MAAEAAVGFVVQTLGNLAIQEAKFLAGISEEVEQVQEELRRLQSFLRDAEAKKKEDKHKDNKRDIQVWIEQSRNIAYEAEDLIEEYAFRISLQKENLSKRVFCFLNEFFVRRSIGLEIRKLKTKMSSIASSFQQYGITSYLNVRGDPSSSQKDQRQRQWRDYSHKTIDDYVKLDNDIEMLVEHLVNENDKHKIVSIYGMGGLGKTTLARNIYTHEKIKRYFENLAWAFISPHLQRTNILQGILLEFFKDKRDEIMKLKDGELLSEVSEIFGSKKCMVVLDDIWSENDWEIFKDAFPLRNNKSKILLTTRNENVARGIAPNGVHHPLRLLNDKESWELLKIKALGEDFQIIGEQLSTEMIDLGMEMVEKCGGLPLAIVVLGGILSTKRDIEQWKIIHKNVETYVTRGEGFQNEQARVKEILELSYDDLPLQLKPCFLYSGIFKDYAIDVESLYQLWIAEGIISLTDQIGDETMMDIAERYLRELEERSLVQVVVYEDVISMRMKRFIRLHDSIRFICFNRAKEENFFSLADIGNSSTNEVSNSFSPSSKIHRLLIYLEHKDDFMKYIPHLKRATSNLRSLVVVDHINIPLIYGISTMVSQINRFQMLRSLEIIREFPINLEEAKMQLQSHLHRGCFSIQAIHESLEFSKSIIRLIHLRYLSIRGYGLFRISSSFDNLKQLQTLNLQYLHFLEIQNIIWKMKKLRHLYLPMEFVNAGINQLRFDGLDKLELIENFDSRLCYFRDLVKLTNLRWLKATVYFNDVDLVEALILLLESKNLLKIDITISISDCCISEEQSSIIFNKLVFSEKIVYLVFELPIIRGLPKYEDHPLGSHLVNLTLFNSGLQEDPMETLGKLSKLKFLKLYIGSFLGSRMVCYSGSFLELRTLVLEGLTNLKEWIIFEGAMPHLLELNFWGCLNLENIPEGLRFIQTLEKLWVISMHEEFTRRIQIIDGQKGEDYYKIEHVPTIMVYGTIETRRFE